MKQEIKYVYTCDNCPHAGDLMCCHNCPLYRKKEYIFNYGTTRQ